MPISSGVCRLRPGSVKSGGTWQVAHLALPSKTALPACAAARSKLPAGAAGVGKEIKVQGGELRGDAIVVRLLVPLSCSRVDVAPRYGRSCSQLCAVRLRS